MKEVFFKCSSKCPITRNFVARNKVWCLLHPYSLVCVCVCIHCCISNLQNSFLGGWRNTWRMRQRCRGVTWEVRMSMTGKNLTNMNRTKLTKYFLPMRSCRIKSRKYTCQYPNRPSCVVGCFYDQPEWSRFERCVFPAGKRCWMMISDSYVCTRRGTSLTGICTATVLAERGNSDGKT